MEGRRRVRKKNTRANGREGRGQEGWKKRADETVGKARIAREFLSNNMSPSTLSLFRILETDFTLPAKRTSIICTDIERLLPR